MKKQVIGALLLALVLTGCTPAPAAETPEPTEGVSPVYTDWSKLTPYEAPKAKYTRRYEGYTDHVIPADDYGPLVPFAGNVVYSKWGGTSYTYGLTTLKGEVVTDPVFLSVEYLEGVEGTPLLLTKTFHGEDFPLRAALCAQDGSWCTDFVYGDGSGFSFGLTGVVGTLGYERGIPMRKGKTGFALVDPSTGEETYTLDWSDALPEGAVVSWSSISMDPATGWVSVDCGYLDSQEAGRNLPLLFDPQGNRRLLPGSVKRVGQYGEGLIPAQGETNTWGYIDADGNWVIEPQYGGAEPFENGVALVWGDRFIDRTGTELVRIEYARRSFHGGGDWFFFNSYNMLVDLYDKDCRKVESPLMGKTVNSQYMMDGWVYLDTTEGAVLIREGETRSYAPELGQLRGFYGERMVFATEKTYLTDREGNVLKKWDWDLNSYTWLQTDPITGEVYLIRRDFSAKGYPKEYYDLDGELVYGGTGTLYGDRVCRTEGDCSVMETLDGETVFYWPVYAGE